MSLWWTVNEFKSLFRAFKSRFQGRSKFGDQSIQTWIMKGARGWPHQHNRGSFSLSAHQIRAGWDTLQAERQGTINHAWTYLEPTLGHPGLRCHPKPCWRPRPTPSGSWQIGGSIPQQAYRSRSRFLPPQQEGRKRLRDSWYSVSRWHWNWFECPSQFNLGSACWG